MKRETFSSGPAVFFATLSSAVGLGNIWLFPYLTGQNGGAAFIIVYLLCVLVIGFPVMICEFIIGRSTRKNVIGAVKNITPKPIFKLIGYLGVASSFLILWFYTSVAGWVYAYVFKAIKGDFSGITAKDAEGIFYNTTLGPIQSVLFQILVLVVVFLILSNGIKNGIERVTKILMPILLGILVICVIKSVTLEGAGEGIKYILMPNFSQITGKVFITAMGLAFFKLSLGMGTMITYASYFTEDSNLPKNSGRVIIGDTMVSMMAGLAIFPAVFSFNLEPTGGPGLLFQTIPLIFSNMTGGYILTVAFFLLSAFAATMAIISMMEVVVAYFSEELSSSGKFSMNRKKSVLLSSIIVIVFGILATLSANEDALFGRVKVFGKSFFDLFNYISSNILLPLGGIFIVMLVAYVMKKQEIFHQLRGNSEGFKTIFIFTIKYISPLFLILIFISSIGIIG